MCKNPIRDLDALRQTVGEPSELALSKIYNHLNEQARFICRSGRRVL